MLDDLRSSALEEKHEGAGEPKQSIEEIFPTREAGRKRFLGLTPAQRFVIAILLVLVTCIIGSACLLIFGKIALPF